MNRVFYIYKKFTTFEETYVIEKQENEYKVYYEIKNGNDIKHSKDDIYIIDEKSFTEFIDEIKVMYKNIDETKILKDTLSENTFEIIIPGLNINIKGAYDFNSEISKLIKYVMDNFIDLNRQNNSSVFENKISFNLKTQNNKYFLQVSKLDENIASLTYIKNTELDKMSIGDIAKNIPIDNYNVFLNKIINITRDWEKAYKGQNDNNKWRLDISTKDYSFYVDGEGDYPSNWNKLIELVAEYEIIFKKLSTYNDN